jgi:hypothetical protein
VHANQKWPEKCHWRACVRAQKWRSIYKLWNFHFRSLCDILWFGNSQHDNVSILLSHTELCTLLSAFSSVCELNSSKPSRLFACNNNQFMRATIKFPILFSSHKSERRRKFLNWKNNFLSFPLCVSCYFLASQVWEVSNPIERWQLIEYRLLIEIYYSSACKLMAKQKVALECLSYHATASQDQTLKLANEPLKSAEEYKLYSFKFIGTCVCDVR